MPAFFKGDFMSILILTLVLVLLDQAVKYWAFTKLSMVGTIPIIDTVFHLTYVENHGAAFSILQNQRWLFLILTPIIMAVIVVILHKKLIYAKTGRIGLYLILAGALGNLIDRIWHGFVVDLFDFRLIHFPVFNVADIYVVCGVALFFYYYLIQHNKLEKAEKENG